MSALPLRAVRAHEIKNHLSVIFAIARLLEKDVPEHVQPRLARIASAVRHVNDIVDDDLKPSSARVQRVATTSHLELCRRVSERVEDLAVSAGVELHVHAHEGGVHGHIDDLVEMLANLVGNAIKASLVAMAVTLTAATREDGAVVFAVEDRGCGMEADAVAAFGSAYRSTFAGGSGVGAAFAREVVARHGGELTVVSEPGRGTQIGIRLPGRV